MVLPTYRLQYTPGVSTNILSGRTYSSQNVRLTQGLFKKNGSNMSCEKNVQIKLTPKNFLLIIFNAVYIEVNETRKKL